MNTLTVQPIVVILIAASVTAFFFNLTSKCLASRDFTRLTLLIITQIAIALLVVCSMRFPTSIKRTPSPDSHHVVEYKGDSHSNENKTLTITVGDNIQETIDIYNKQGYRLIRIESDKSNGTKLTFERNVKP